MSEERQPRTSEDSQEPMRKVIGEALGEVSVLFMSRECKGTEIVMPSTELLKIGDKLYFQLGLVDDVVSDLKEKLRVAEEEKQRWANCCGEMIMTCHTCKELDQLKAENERLREKYEKEESPIIRAAKDKDGVGF